MTENRALAETGNHGRVLVATRGSDESAEAAGADLIVVGDTACSARVVKS